MDELEVVAKLKCGENEAFRQVVRDYQRHVLNCSYKFLRNKESAEDITQEVFLEVYESISSFRGDARLSTWIYRICVTKCLNHIKSMKRKKRFAMLVSLFDNDNAIHRMASHEGVTPDSGIENEERTRILSWALEKLPDNQRIAFTLSKYDELSYDEIAGVMDLSISSVESLIHRAKTNLRKVLSRYYEKHLV